MAINFRAAFAVALLACTVHVSAGEVEWKMLTDQANLHVQRGSLQQAELFAREAIAEAERSFGPKHRVYDQSIATLGLVLRFAQRYPESEKEFRRALALREKALGPRDPAVAILVNNLADVVQAQKKYAEAEKLQRTVLPLFEKVHGDDTKTATALNNLGANLQSQTRYKEAEPYLRRALAMKEKVLGPLNPSVAHTLNNLAEVCEALGRKDEAAKHRARAVEIQKQASAKV